MASAKKIVKDKFPNAKIVTTTVHTNEHDDCSYQVYEIWNGATLLTGIRKLTAAAAWRNASSRLYLFQPL